MHLYWVMNKLTEIENPDMHSKQILIIEDDRQTLLMLQWILQEQGFQVHASQDFNDAADFLSQHQPSLIISDLLGSGKTTGLDFYLQHVMEKKIPFALVSGTFYLLPSKVRFVKNSQNPQVGSITLDNLHKSSDSIQCFEKPFDVSDILHHFHLSPAA